MKEHNDEVPQAMRIRQEIQESMNNSLPEKKFRKEKIDVVEIDIELDNLGWDFHNYRILNLTDIHLGQWVTPEYLDELIDYVNTLNYDVATLTGDYISYIIDGYEDCLKDSFKKLKSNDGKFGVLGNHDHWMGADTIREIFRDSDITDLSNDVCVLSKGESKLNLAGVDSCTVCADNLDAVLAKLDDDNPTVLLVHEPDFAEESSKTGKIDLEISGHSHGGQFVIPKLETTPLRGPNSTKYPIGYYKIGRMNQYTSKGLGTNSFRIRINCKPEITIITLKNGNKKRIKIE
ncbi:MULTISPECIES: metallophosphoesterase [Methanobrevibacter]|uniref:Putative metallophosphoesterase n=1 Tax=Methanobrevibacter thaueri TaxID=190975 RepID=A0A315XLS3_9EURY|nr:MULTISPECIES: metallophosphoesterase [Methanobrevibacter]MBR2665761.1 metallophosphoesterase [Methanobrevibacter sp.]PWB85476.1 putative metallophosphoesterase [Methanobrevibacter thaueri]